VFCVPRGSSCVGCWATDETHGRAQVLGSRPRPTSDPARLSGQFSPIATHTDAPMQAMRAEDPTHTRTRVRGTGSRLGATSSSYGYGPRPALLTIRNFPLLRTGPKRYECRQGWASPPSSSQAPFGAPTSLIADPADEVTRGECGAAACSTAPLHSHSGRRTVEGERGKGAGKRKPTWASTTRALR
jgi:hypothetical protein